MKTFNYNIRKTGEAFKYSVIEDQIVLSREETYKVECQQDVLIEYAVVLSVFTCILGMLVHLC